MRLVQKPSNTSFDPNQASVGPDSPLESPNYEIGVSTTSSINGEPRSIATMDQIFSPIYTRDQTELSRVLSEYKVDLTEIDADGQTALHLAISLGNDDAVVRLVSYAGDDPTILNAPNRDGHDALTRVSLPANVPLMKVLIEAGARSKLFDSDVDDSIADDTGYSVSMAKLLITARGDITRAFEDAIEDRYTHSLDWLSTNGVDVASVFKNYLSATHRSKYDAMQILSKNLLDFNQFESIITEALQSDDIIEIRSAHYIIYKTQFGKDLTKQYLNQNKPFLFATARSQNDIGETWGSIANMDNRKVSDTEKIAAMKSVTQNRNILRNLEIDSRDLFPCADIFHAAGLVKSAGASLNTRAQDIILQRYITGALTGCSPDNVKTMVSWLNNPRQLKSVISRLEHLRRSMPNLGMDDKKNKENNRRTAEIAYECIKQHFLYSDKPLTVTDKANLIAQYIASDNRIEIGAKKLLVQEIIAQNSENVEILLEAKVLTEDILIDLARLKHGDILGQCIAKGADYKSAVERLDANIQAYKTEKNYIAARDEQAALEQIVMALTKHRDNVMFEASKRVSVAQHSS